MKSLPRVAIVGRPNVGKSTLFNRITGQRRALVHHEPGVTRDVQRGEAEWSGVDFELIDTGGLFSGVDDALVAQVEERAMREALSADAILFVTDAQSGLIPADRDVADRVRATNIPVLLVANKTEARSDRHSAGDFYALGFPTLYEISALHGEGVGDVLEDLVALLPRSTSRDLAPELRLAIVGMPNVGKSSLINAVIGAEAEIVDDRPGTTRDSIDVALRWQGRNVILVDTAGIRRRARTKQDVDVLSSIKSLQSIDRCDVAVLMLDASRGISNQDVRVGGYIHKAGKGVVVCFNKWDLVAKEDRTYREFEREFERRFGYLSYAPILFISALTRQRVGKVMETAWAVKEGRERRVPTSTLNEFVESVVERHPPPFYGGGNGRIYYGTQVDVAPPTFALFVNKRRFFGRNYLRFLNNQIRKTFSYDGTIIRIDLVEKKRGEARA